MTSVSLLISGGLPAANREYNRYTRPSQVQPDRAEQNPVSGVNRPLRGADLTHLCIRNRVANPGG